MLSSLAAIGFDLSPKELNDVVERVGRHPYLLACLGFHLVKSFAQSNQDVVMAALNSSRSAFEAYFDLITRHCEEDGSYSCLLSLVTGSRTYCAPTSLEKLKKSQLISQTTSGYYSAFSKSFANHLIHLGAIKASNDLLVKGSIVNDQYRILNDPKITAHSQLAQARDEHLKRTVAVKRVYLASLDSNSLEKQRAILEREGQILAQLHHPNIGEVYAIVTEPLTVVMEWVEGESLQDLLDRDFDFPLEQVIKIGIEVADALGYVHCHAHCIIHRDVKPGNIILQENGHVKLVDFDIARALNSDTITGTRNGPRVKLGVALYGAPEQLDDSSSVQTASDIFSLGVVLYELCTHSLPYRNGNLPASNGGCLPVPHQLAIPSQLYHVLCLCLQEDPNARPGAIELKEKLANCLSC